MTEVPLFSIVIPTYNRPKSLAECLTALTQLDYPHDRLEVIVVDDGSTMSLEPVVNPFRDSLTIALITQTNQGPATARNTGASHAQGAYLAFTDDDCRPAPDWLTNFAVQFAKTPTALLGGHSLNALPSNLYSTASQTLIDYIYWYYNISSNRPTFFASNNMALPTLLFHEVGGFNTTFPLAAGEDREFCHRWLHAGYPMQYVPTARIHHAHQLSLKTYWKQHFNYGRGAYHFHCIRAQRDASPMRVEPLSFYINLLTFPFSQLLKQPPILISLLLVVSQVAGVLGFVWEHRNQLASAA
ncbi:MAG: glycosyltransferase family 2 protein [Cyanobacteria bacterium]|nr:glycosyltransferase family 2 protein [Cyanobacteriota bacterium]MDW8201468.1 glycosyltransferase [Cyanobacteriota bacterium SKYGB_h_bin112]